MRDRLRDNDPALLGTFPDFGGPSAQVRRRCEPAPARAGLLRDEEAVGLNPGTPAAPALVSRVLDGLKPVSPGVVRINQLPPRRQLEA